VPSRDELDIRDVHDERDPIADGSSHAGNLLSLLVLKQDYLTRYEALPSFQKDPIEAYRTQGLFERFALDNYPVLHALKKRRRPLQDAARRLYNETVASIGTARLEERLDTLRRPGFHHPVPDRRSADLPAPRTSADRADCA